MFSKERRTFCLLFSWNIISLLVSELVTHRLRAWMIVAWAVLAPLELRGWEGPHLGVDPATKDDLYLLSHRQAHS